MKTALIEFAHLLDGVRDIASDIDAHAADALRDRAVGRRHVTIQCACTVALSGYFESFLRDTAEACVTEICAKGKPFASLDQQMRDAHFEQGGLILASLARARRTNKVTWIKASVDDVAKRLHSVFASTNYQMVWEAFAETRSNPGPDVIGDFLRRFGVKKPWPKLAVKVSLAYKVSKTEGSLTEGLKSFIEVRNECAHTGRANVIPLPSDLRQYCNLLQSIASAIVAVLDDHLISLSKAS